jgi:predicted RNA binding protein YcfA (HicA-like mRNA interferase family)
MPPGWKPKKAADIVKDLEQAGFAEAKGRGKGSHRIFKGKGKTIVVPDHGGKDVKTGTMRNIAKQAGMKPEDLYGFQQKGAARQLTPTEVNAGVANAADAVKVPGNRNRAGGRRAGVSAGRERDERTRRR